MLSPKNISCWYLAGYYKVVESIYLLNRLDVGEYCFYEIPQFTRIVRDLVNSYENFLNRWIGCGGPILLRDRSVDFNSWHFLAWELIKEKACMRTSLTTDEVMALIHAAVLKTTPARLEWILDT